jgi:predicted  nucleic acid-binding Zn-ribbon protein
MKESLAMLLELQNIDLEIDALGRSQIEYPTEISELEAKLDHSKSNVEGKRKQTEELETNRRLMEGELEAIQADLKKRQDRLYEVASNKEYDALQHEIEALKNRLDENENGILEGIDLFDGLKERLAEEETTHKELETESKKIIKGLKSKLGSVEENVRECHEKRTGVETQIDRRALSVYNRIRKLVKTGAAVVQVEKSSCGGCFRQLPPQLRMEVRRQDQIIRCENCGRIVIWKEEAGA